jgi:D-alanyl-D-alanine carboxypeptidase
MGAKNRNQLFQTVEEAFEEAFGEYEIAQPVKKGSPAPAPLPVAGGRTPTVEAVAGGDLRVLIKSEEKATIATQVQPTNPPAPIEAGERVGWLVVTNNGKQAGRIPLVAAASVPTRSLGQKIWSTIWPF